MNCVQSPSLEWENTGKRARPAITIKLKLISTPVRAWFMAPVPPASKVQISNRRESDGMGNKERQRENKREGKMSAFYFHFIYFFPFRAWRKVKLFFQSNCSSTVCFWKGICFSFVEFMVWISLKTALDKAEAAQHSPSAYATASLLLFFSPLWEGCGAAAQFCNIRQEQMMRACLPLGVKCQLPHITSKDIVCFHWE